ncbi:MAG: glycosyltransferase family 39 protein [Anaerolineales bacterium]
MKRLAQSLAKFLTDAPAWLYSAALVLGLAFGLFVYAHWLSASLPPTSRRLTIYTLLACLLGAAGHFVLLKAILLPSWRRFQPASRRFFLVWGLAGGFLGLFFGSNVWESQTDYLTFLLPRQSLELSARPAAGAEAQLVWMNTSLGEVSFDAAELNGWEKVEGTLLWRQTADNFVRWRGRTGGQALLVWATSPAASQVTVTWNGVSETIDLFSDTPGQLTRTYPFEVPFYASPGAVIFLGLLNASLLFAALSALAWFSLQEPLAELRSRFSEDGKSENRRRRLLLDGAALLGLLALAFLLRVFRLEALSPYTDEYMHLLAARSLVQGVPVAQVGYERSLFIVTLPVALFFRLFGVSLWSARLAGVVFNALAVLPLYFVARRLNRPLAVLAGLLYAASPWVIGMARTVREYAYYPLYFYLIILGMLALIERFPPRFVLRRDGKALLKPDFIALALALLIPVIYSRFLDENSTFSVVLSAYLVLVFFLLARLDWSHRENLIVLALLLAGGLIGYGWFVGSNGLSANVFSTAGRVRDLFFSDAPQQAFYGRTTVVPLLALGSALLVSVYLRQKPALPFIVVLFFGSALAFSLLFAGFASPRYYFHLQIWYLPLLAVGLYALWFFLWLLLKRLKWSPVAAGLAALLPLALSLNVRQILLPTLWDQPGLMPVTGQYHENVADVHAYLLAQASDQDVLIATVYANYSQWVEAPPFRAIYSFDYRRPDGRDYLLSLVAQNPSGWIVLDQIRYEQSQPIPLETFSSAGRLVEYRGQFADEYVWHWQAQTAPGTSSP